MTEAPPDLAAWPLVGATAELVSGNLLAVGLLQDGRFECVNRACAEMFGCSPEQLAGTPVAELAGEAERPAIRDSLGRCGEKAGQACCIEFTGLRRDGGIVVVELRATGTGRPGGAAAVLLDVTERSHAVNRLRNLAFHDALTDLPNRSLFFDRLRQCVAVARRSRERAAVMLADLDGFKAVNDACGHAAGDALLQVVARRLAACSRMADTVARIGGDEFAAILPSVGGPEQAAAVAERMIEALREPLPMLPRECRVSVSIGIALCPDHGTDVDRLIGLADAAMYASKARGKNTFSFAQEAQLVPPPHVLLPWSDALNLGLPVIDGQHRRLVDLLNAVGDALRGDAGAAAANAAMQDLVSHTELHFRTEEGLMGAYGAADLERHRQEHRVLLSDLRCLGAEIEATSVMLALQHLKAWLVRHIDSLDREFTTELRERARRQTDCPA
jgi:diguanylate cyclase (GGDEF)-like protein/hemerythrin-like metal-binding protein/PAS domain S-box-containing protein